MRQIQVLVDWLELDYQAAYRAVDDLLEFRAPAPGRQVFEIGGFQSAQVDVFDVTDPARPVRIVGQQIVPDAGTYAVRFADEAVAGSRYVALRADRYLAPVRIERDSPSALRAPAEGADYLVITHSDFYTAAVALAEHRREQGLRTATVRVEDIFDEFADGIFNPEAIRDFLAFAFAHWPAPAPKYVVLFGDAFQDYRDALGWASTTTCRPCSTRPRISARCRRTLASRSSPETICCPICRSGACRCAAQKRPRRSSRS